jgi:hypothetical protein
MSRFILTPDNQLVGYSVWPWDPLYAPLVGLFDAGVLIAVAACDKARADLTSTAVRLPLRSRIKRRVLRALGRPMPPPPLDLAGLEEGPSVPAWFALTVAEPLAARLRAGDGGVRLERLEDSTPVLPAGSPEGSPMPEPAQVEHLLSEPHTETLRAQDGFADFLSAPPQHQLEVAFVEYLRRMPEQGARDAYLPQLQSGALDIFGLRALIVGSEEFRSRRIGFGSRLGASLTSPLWSQFKETDAVLEAHQALPAFETAGLEDLDEDGFVAAVGGRMLGRPPTAAEDADLRRLATSVGRQAAAREMARWAARRGDFLVVR